MYGIYVPACTMKNQPDVGKYTSPMDGLGYAPWNIMELE